MRALVLNISLTCCLAGLTGLAFGQISDSEIDAMTVTVKLADLDFAVYDAGNGEPVVLLHGFPDSRFLWRYQMQALLDNGYRVIAPDLKGYGDSSKPAAVEDYRLPIVVNEVLGILDTMGVSSFHLIGHDWGAAISWIIAATTPDKVKKLITLSVGAPGNPGTRTFEQIKAGWYGFVIANSQGVEDLFRRNDWEFFKKLTENNGDTERHINDLSRPGALTAALNYYRANFRADFNNFFQIPTIKSDVMGIWSDGDIYLTEGHVTGSSTIVDGKWRYEKINGASHWMMVDKPQEVNRLIIDFLAQ